MTPHRHFVLLVLLAASQAAAGSNISPADFPYEASLAADDVYIRSGPGTEYYPTDKLNSGDTVEVYRHDPAGWCAIRPPRGSFTWISSRFLKRRDERLGEIVGSRVAARVGSRFSLVRDAVQVRLEHGELVEILEVSEDGQWTKIAPPSGEFRWIHGQFIEPKRADSALRRVPMGSNPVTGDPFHLSEDAAPFSAEDLRDRRDVSRFDPAGPDFQAEPPGSFAHREQRKRTPEEFAAELDDLNIELSMMVAEEPTVWEFGELGLRAERLLAESQTAVERGRSRILLTKIRRFEDIRDRYRKVNALASRTERLNRHPPTAALGNTLADRRAGSSRFDGSGRLTRVHSPKSGAPRFALTDEQGAVHCYVTPAPGVNMQYYLDKEIGVNGMRGYIPEQRAPHITAKHVEVLNGAIIR